MVIAPVRGWSDEEGRGVEPRPPDSWSRPRPDGCRVELNSATSRAVLLCTAEGLSVRLLRR
ncbi:hypothetical protein [Streptomyces sp. NPDC003635]